MRSILPIFLILLLFIENEGLAQRRKKEVGEPRVLNEDERMKVDRTFIEGEKELILENFTKAYDLFLLAEEMDPTNAAIQFKLSQVLQKNGELEKALIYISSAIDLAEGNKFYWLEKGEILKGLNRPEQAAEVYVEMMKKIPGTEEYLYDLASIYHFLGDWNEALTRYNEIEEHFGISHALLREKQKIHLQRSDMSSLIGDWDKLLIKNPNDEGLILELCNILISNNMTEEAEARLEDLRNRFPENVTAYLQLSEIARKRGDVSKALALLEVPISNSTVEVFPKIQTLNHYVTLNDNNQFTDVLSQRVAQMVVAHPESYQALAYAGDFYLGQQESERALSFYLQAVEISPANFSVWQNIVNLEAEAGQVDSLEVHSAEAIEYFPNQPIFYYFNGFANYMIQDYRKASRTLEQGKKYTSDPGLLAIFYGQLGDVYHSTDNHNKSDQSYEDALKNDPNNDHVLNNYSYYLSERKTNLEKAAKMSTKLIELFPENGTYLDTHGWVLYVLGEYEEAEKYLKRAMGLIDDGTIVEHYGDVQFKLGKVEEAVIHWKKALELGGTSDQIDKKIEDRKIYE